MARTVIRYGCPGPREAAGAAAANYRRLAKNTPVIPLKPSRNVAREGSGMGDELEMRKPTMHVSKLDPPSIPFVFAGDRHPRFAQGEVSLPQD